MLLQTYVLIPVESIEEFEEMVGPRNLLWQAIREISEQA